MFRYSATNGVEQTVALYWSSQSSHNVAVYWSRVTVTRHHCTAWQRAVAAWRQKTNSIFSSSGTSLLSVCHAALLAWYQYFSYNLLIVSQEYSAGLESIIGFPYLGRNLKNNTYRSCQKHKSVESDTFHWSPFETCSVHNKDRVKFA